MEQFICFVRSAKQAQRYRVYSHVEQRINPECDPTSNDQCGLRIGSPAKSALLAELKTDTAQVFDLSVDWNLSAS